MTVPETSTVEKGAGRMATLPRPELGPLENLSRANTQLRQRVQSGAFGGNPLERVKVRFAGL
jgi:hypothetical protein